MIKKLLQKWRRKRELRKSNYGREYGWYLECEGKDVGELVNPEWVEMFWTSYEIISYDDSIVYNKDLWTNCVFRYRNKKLNEYADYAFAAIYIDTPGIKKGDKVLMRGLYLV